MNVAGRNVAIFFLILPFYYAIENHIFKKNRIKIKKSIRNERKSKKILMNSKKNKETKFIIIKKYLI